MYDITDLQNGSSQTRPLDSDISNKKEQTNLSSAVLGELFFFTNLWHISSKLMVGFLSPYISQFVLYEICMHAHKMNFDLFQDASTRLYNDSPRWGGRGEGEEGSYVASMASDYLLQRVLSCSNLLDWAFL